MPDPLIALLILAAMAAVLLWPTKTQRDALRARRIATINRQFEQAIQDPCRTLLRRDEGQP